MLYALLILEPLLKSCLWLEVIEIMALLIEKSVCYTNDTYIKKQLKFNLGFCLLKLNASHNECSPIEFNLVN